MVGTTLLLMATRAYLQYIRRRIAWLTTTHVIARCDLLDQALELVHSCFGSLLVFITPDMVTSMKMGSVWMRFASAEIYRRLSTNVGFGN